MTPSVLGVLAVKKADILKMSKDISKECQMSKDLLCVRR